MDQTRLHWYMVHRLSNFRAFLTCLGLPEQHGTSKPLPMQLSVISDFTNDSSTMSHEECKNSRYFTWNMANQHSIHLYSYSKSIIYISMLFIDSQFIQYRGCPCKRGVHVHVHGTALLKEKSSTSSSIPLAIPPVSTVWCGL